MANSHEQSTSEPTHFLAALVPYRRQLSIAFFVAAALVLIVPIWLLVRIQFQLLHLELWALFLWSLAVALAFLVAGIVNSAYEPAPEVGEVGKLRVLLLALGGAVGLATTLLGFALPWTYEPYSEVYREGLTRWREYPSALVWPGVALFGGLLLMFLAVQLARGMERTSGLMRRLLFGYNAVLTSILLLAALGLLNVLSYSGLGPFKFFDRTFNWTASGFYELSPGSKELLASLNQPVKVYVLMPQNELPTADTENLLASCRGLSHELTWVSLSRDRDRPQIQELREKYGLPDSLGLLVVYGTEPRVESQFIKFGDLYREEPGLSANDPGKYVYTGEGALMKALKFLSENKTRPVIYFTQGEGELAFEARGRGRGEEDLSALRDRLREGNYDTKELRLADLTRVPDDAELVVIPRPTRELPEAGLKALREYVRGTSGKKGKLIVLTDVVLRRGGQGSGMVKTGLEDFLKGFNVQLGDDRVLALRSRFPTVILAYVNPDLDNPIARTLSPRVDRLTPFVFEDVRTVSPLQAGPGGAYTVEELMYALPDLMPWSETNLDANPQALATELRKPEAAERRREKIKDKLISVAVTVAETKGGAPLDRFHAGLNKGQEEPRMVVFGDSDWVASDMLNSPQQGRNNYTLFLQSVSWLRGRPDVPTDTSSDKVRQEYTLNVPAPAVSRIIWLPLGLMFLGVLGLGCGLWVVRRR